MLQSGWLQTYDSQLYRQVKKVRRVRYLKCTIEHCDGSAKLDNVWPRSVWKTPIYTTSQSQTWNGVCLTGVLSVQIASVFVTIGRGRTPLHRTYRFPLPVRSAVISNLTAWWNQILSSRALNALTYMYSFQIFSTFAIVDPTEPNPSKTDKSPPNLQLWSSKWMSCLGMSVISCVLNADMGR